MNRTLYSVLSNTLFYFAMMQIFACNNHDSIDQQTITSGGQAAIAVIKKMEKERLAAGIKKDVALYDSTTASDYLQIDLEGRVLDKSTMLERIKSNYAQLQSNETDDVQIRIYGNTAILTAQGHPRGILNEKEFTDNVCYTRIYVKRNGRWQVVLFQQTRVNASK